MFKVSPYPQSMAKVYPLMNNKAPFPFEVQLPTISEVDIKYVLKTISLVLFSKCSRFKEASSILQI